MNWRGRVPVPSSEDERLLREACKRVVKLSTTSLLDWADAAGSGMAKGFMDYRKHGDYASLEDIALGMISLRAVVYELKARKDAEEGRL
jgi:hypothetical protein